MQVNVEAGAGSYTLGCCPDPPLIAFDDAFADGKPQTGTGVFVLIEPLEQAEDFIGILRRKADTVILNRNEPHLPLLLCLNLDARYLPRRLIFKRIGDQVLEDLAQLSRVCLYGR